MKIFTFDHRNLYSVRLIPIKLCLVSQASGNRTWMHFRDVGIHITVSLIAQLK